MVLFGRCRTERRVEEVKVGDIENLVGAKGHVRKCMSRNPSNSGKATRCPIVEGI